eukprot:5533511-Pleurochrysis_carterae.AAC.2
MACCLHRPPLLPLVLSALHAALLLSPTIEASLSFDLQNLRTSSGVRHTTLAHEIAAQVSYAQNARFPKITAICVRAGCAACFPSRLLHCLPRLTTIASRQESVGASTPYVARFVLSVSAPRHQFTVPHYCGIWPPCELSDQTPDAQMRARKLACLRADTPWPVCTCCAHGVANGG